ncbi:MAG: hypothetical protein RSA40_00730 [Malacoplasma sp.]
MKRKNIKLLCFFVVGIPSLIIAPILLANNNLAHLQDVNSNLNINNKSLYAVGDGEEEETKFTFRANDEISWTNKKYANEVTISDLQELLIPTSPSANFSIDINTPTADDIKNGVVKFTIKQQLNKYQNGITVPGRQVVISPETGQGTGSIWETPANLVLPKKFRFNWASTTTIESFVMATNKRFHQLTKSDVLNNLIDSTSILPDFANINVSFSDIPNVSNSGNLYGVGNIDIAFTNTTGTDWVSGTLPTATETKLTIRGLTTTSNNRSTMELSINPLVNISNNPLDSAGKTAFAKYLLTSNATPRFGDLFASQFISLPQDVLINMLFSGLYSTNKTPVASITYMGMNVKDASFSTSTGIPSNIVSQIKITNIETSINDLLGSLTMIYKYNVYDIFSSSIISKESIQQFPNNTFRPNIDAGKNLIFEWTDQSLLVNGAQSTLGTSYNLVNSFKNNINDNLYILNLSSYFFEGSEDTYNQPRTVDIDYLGGGTIDAGQGYIPLQTNQTKIVIKIWFNTWGGAKYQETGNPEKYGYYTQQTFDLLTYNYNTTETVSWKSQDELFNKLPRLNTFLPSNISYEVFKSSADKYIKLEDFVTISSVATTDIAQTILFPNDVNGTIEIKTYIQSRTDPIGSGRVYLQFYSGFAKSDSNSSVVEFGWIPQIDVPNELLSKEIVEVTVADVIALYLDKIPLFKNKVLTANNVNIEIDQNNPTFLIISVTIPLFNQDQNNPSNQTFYTVINGFVSSTSNNTSDFVAPDNFTMIIAASGATFVIVLLTIIIMFVLFKTIFIKKIKPIKKDSKKNKDKRGK